MTTHRLPEMRRFLTMTLFSRARSAKHRLFLVSRNWRSHREAAARERVARAAERTPFEWDPDRYRTGVGTHADSDSTTFPVNHLLFPSPAVTPAASAPPVLWLIWAGDNELTPNRRRSLDAITAANPELEVRLVTPATVSRWIVDGHPLHRAYQHLSHLHRSDYLRAYLMLHHGGVYCDIKEYTASFAPLLERLNSNPSLWAVGAPERDPEHTGPALGPLGDEQRLRFRQSLSQFCFAFKAGTPLAAEWVAEIERRLAYFEDLLAAQDTLQPYGENPEYPVPWSSLMAFVANPLSLKHHERIAVDPSIGITWHSDGYR